MRVTLSSSLLVFLFLLLCALNTSAQTQTTGAISGNVKDVALVSKRSFVTLRERLIAVLISAAPGDGNCGAPRDPPGRTDM